MNVYNSYVEMRSDFKLFEILCDFTTFIFKKNFNNDRREQLREQQLL